MTRRRYRPRARVNTPGCVGVGCSAPMLLVTVAVAWVLLVAMARPG